MRKRALLMAVVIALTILASTRVASAQELMVVNIPFDFAVGTKTLPAGEYSVKDSAALHTLLLIDRDDPAENAFLPTQAVDAHEIQSESKLVFNRYGNRYFLSQVWSAENPVDRSSQGRIAKKKWRKLRESRLRVRSPWSQAFPELTPELNPALKAANPGNLDPHSGFPAPFSGPLSCIFQPHRILLSM